MRATGLDHVVLVCADVERSLRWWQDTFGLAPERVEQWRAGQAPFPSLRLDATTIIDLVGGERTGENVAHLAVVVDTGGRPLADVLRAEGLMPLGEPRELYGARGTGVGAYLRDPDGNVVEVRSYPPA